MTESAYGQFLLDYVMPTLVCLACASLIALIIMGLIQVWRGKL